MTKVIYGKNSLRNTENIFVSEFDFKPYPADSQPIKRAMAVLNSISGKELQGNRVIELFCYREINMWWFCHARLAAHIIDTVNFINNFLIFVRQHTPSEIYIKDDFSKFELIKEICMKENITFTFSSVGYARSKIISKTSDTGKKRAIKLLTNKKINSRLKISKNCTLPDIENKILFASYPNYKRPIYDSKNKKSVIGEFLTDDIIKLLKIKSCSIGIDFFSMIRTDDHTLQLRLNEGDIPWFPAEMLLSRKSNPDHTKFLSDFERIISLDSFLDLFKFQNISFGRYILPFLRSFASFDCYLPYWLKLIDALDRHLEQNKPHAVFLVYETAPPSLALISVCRKHDIKTIGVQHGIIHDSHPLYMHDSLHSTTNPSGFILPDHLLLFGNITRDYLISLGYPPEALICFCNTNFLHIEDLKDSRQEILDKLGIPKNKINIILSLPGLSDYADSKQNYNIEILQNLLNNLTDDYFLMIKPHPADDDSVYENVLKNRQKSNARIVKNNILELIVASDVQISTFSTTMIDGMCMGVPVVQVKIDGVQYERPYDTFGAVLATNLENILPSIHKVMSEPNLRNKLIVNGRKFAKQYYNIPIKNPESIIWSILWGTADDM